MRDRKLIKFQDCNGITNEYQWNVYGSLVERKAGDLRNHYASDEQGSTIFLTDAEGKVKNRYTYDAFGNTIEAEEQIPNRYQYTGQQLDPLTQQYYLRARFYNPAIARFTQEDEYQQTAIIIQKLEK